MGLLAELSLRGKRVLLIGGGKQALRKAKKLQKQGAFLTAVAPSFLEEFFTICDRVLTQSYDRSLIAGSFLVIAATDNPELNHQIVQDANEQGALSMSIQADENATVHSVGSREFEGITAAVSTHGVYPALDSLLLDCWQDSSSTLIKKLPVLGELRKKILSTSLSAEGKREILRSLPMWEERTLTGLIRATQQRMLLIPVWHGTASPQSMKTEVFPFSGEMETRFSPIPVCEAFLSGKMRDKLSDRDSTSKRNTGFGGRSGNSSDCAPADLTDKGRLLSADGLLCTGTREGSYKHWGASDKGCKRRRNALFLSEDRRVRRTDPIRIPWL